MIIVQNKIDCYLILKVYYNMSNIKRINFIDDDDTFFVHFNSSKDCNIFKQNFSGTLGNICCNGKGIHVKTYNGTKVDNDKIYDIIRKEYKTK